MEPLESIQPQRERERMRGSSPPRSFSIKTITPSPYRSRVHHRADDSVDENGASGRVAGTQLSLRRERREKGAKRTCNYHRVEGVTPKRRREEAKKRLEGKNNTVLSPSSLLRGEDGQRSTSGARLNPRELAVEESRPTTRAIRFHRSIDRSRTVAIIEMKLINTPLNYI